MTSPLPSEAVSDHGASGRAMVSAYDEVSKTGVGTRPAPDGTGVARPEHPTATRAHRARSRSFMATGTHHTRRGFERKPVRIRGAVRPGNSAESPGGAARSPDHRGTS